MELQQAVELSKRVQNEIKKSVKGKDDCIRKAFCAILAGGHILIEDVPGVGKTTLALAFSRALCLENHRVQFTPDVLPADILGFIIIRVQSCAICFWQMKSTVLLQRPSQPC